MSLYLSVPQHLLVAFCQPNFHVVGAMFLILFSPPFQQLELIQAIVSYCCTNCATFHIEQRLPMFNIVQSVR